MYGVRRLERRADKNVAAFRKGHQFRSQAPLPANKLDENHWVVSAGAVPARNTRADGPAAGFLVVIDLPAGASKVRILHRHEEPLRETRPGDMTWLLAQLRPPEQNAEFFDAIATPSENSSSNTSHGFVRKRWSLLKSPRNN